MFLSNLAPEMLDGWNLVVRQAAADQPPARVRHQHRLRPLRRRSQAPFDMTVQALTGIMARLGEPGQPPIYLGMGSGDAYGGLMSAFGIVLALYQRGRTGKGQMHRCVPLRCAAVSRRAAPAGLSRRQHASAPCSIRAAQAANPLWNLYPTTGKWVYLCEPNEDERFRRYAGPWATAVLARPALCRAAGAVRNNDALVAAIEA